MVQPNPINTHIPKINPYQYVQENMVYFSFKELEGTMDYGRLCSTLRRYDRFREYDLAYWDKLFCFFCSPKETIRPFANFEQLEYEVSLEGCLNRCAVK